MTSRSAYNDYMNDYMKARYARRRADAAAYGAGRRYGVQRPGNRYKGGAEDALRAILEDRTAAMAQYGHLTNHCGVCGRILEDAESVERGIGPICWGRL